MADLEPVPDRVNEADLLAELLAATSAHDLEGGGMTAAEIAEALNVNLNKARRLIKSRIDAGAIECVWLPRARMDGVIVKRPCYRLATKNPGG